VSKDRPSKGKKPPERPATETPDVTSSQILSTRDLGQAPAPPPPRQPRRSTTHGVGWYAAEDGEDVAQPVRGGKRRTLLIAILVTLIVLVAGLAGAFVWMRTRTPTAPTVAAVMPADAAPAIVAPPDAAVKLAKVGLSSTPPGAEFVVDGKAVGKGPAEIEAAEKSRLVVEASLPGHQPWKQEVEVAARGNKVVAKLVPIVVDAGVAESDAAPAVEPAPAKKVTKTPAKKVKKKVAPTRKKRRSTHR